MSIPERTPPIDPHDPLVEELELLMRDLLIRYERLRTLGVDRLEAIRRCDGSRLSAVIGQENLLVQEIAEIEKRRIGVVGRFAERVGSPAKSQTTMSWLAERVGEPVRGRLLGLARTLRETIGAVKHENQIARATAEALAQHMGGLMRTVAAHLNHAKTYGRAGTVEAGPAVISALDVTS
jgi:hypothetical protein